MLSIDQNVRTYDMSVRKQFTSVGSGILDFNYTYSAYFQNRKFIHINVSYSHITQVFNNKLLLSSITVEFSLCFTSFTFLKLKEELKLSIWCKKLHLYTINQSIYNTPHQDQVRRQQSSSTKVNNRQYPSIKQGLFCHCVA